MQVTRRHAFIKAIPFMSRGSSVWNSYPTRSWTSLAHLTKSASMYVQKFKAGALGMAIYCQLTEAMHRMVTGALMS